MSYRITLIAALLASALAFSPRQLAAQTTTPQQPSQHDAASSINSPAHAIPAYADSPDGLEHLMKDMLKLQKRGDAKDLAPYVQSLIPPDPSVWFTTTFGGKLGAAMAGDYDRTRLNLPLSFPDTLSQIQSKHLTRVQAIHFTDSCDLEATDSEYPVLLSRTHDQPLYDVRFSSRTETATVSFFAYIDGAFRYISNFRIPNPAIPILKVGGVIIAKKVVYAPAPQYPFEAKINHISGTVVFHAMIGPDGNVCNLQVVQGPSELIEASFAAVRTWRYSPTTLNGKPAVVATTITVVFTLEE